MLPSYLSIFIASILGSVHCAAMCGGFVGFCSAAGPKPSLSLAAYHAGRLASYCALGAVAGTLGQSIDSAVALTGLHQATALITGIMLVLWGLGSFFSLSYLSLPVNNSIAANSVFTRIFRWTHSPGNPYLKTFVLGLCTGLLPCGWLYTYVALAATTGDTISGSLLMACFWAGTVPILSAIGGLSRVVTVRLTPYLPKIVGFLLIFAGMFSLYTHISHSHHDHNNHGHTHHQH